MSKWTRDMLERVVRTFAGAFLAQAAGAVTGVVDIDSAKAAFVAAVAAGISAVLSWLARSHGSGPDTASFEV